jgi:outer membrane protein OmpA-like peptidoglycan-associated protein
MYRLVLCSLLLLAAPVFAQTAVPSAEQMVEQLRTPPRTRSLRNLTVEPVAPVAGTEAASGNGVTANTAAATAASDAPEAPAPRPSLSLSIQFDFDSSRIRPESLVALGNLAAALGSPALLPSKFVIEGHTDAKGSADYNRKLSDQRAAAVKDLLVAKGIEAGRLLSVGKGSSEPANASAPLAAENRRVKIVNLD